MRYKDDYKPSREEFRCACGVKCADAQSLLDHTMFCPVDRSRTFCKGRVLHASQ